MRFRFDFFRVVSDWFFFRLDFLDGGLFFLVNIVFFFFINFFNIVIFFMVFCMIVFVKLSVKLWIGDNFVFFEKIVFFLIILSFFDIMVFVMFFLLIVEGIELIAESDNRFFCLYLRDCVVEGCFWGDLIKIFLLYMLVMVYILLFSFFKDCLFFFLDGVLFFWMLDLVFEFMKGESG